MVHGFELFYTRAWHKVVYPRCSKIRHNIDTLLQQYETERVEDTTTRHGQWSHADRAGDGFSQCWHEVRARCLDRAGMSFWPPSGGRRRRAYLRIFAIEGARIGAGSAACRTLRVLRPGTNLGPGAKVGNFVEIKSTTLGASAKVNAHGHLSRRRRSRRRASAAATTQWDDAQQGQSPAATTRIPAAAAPHRRHLAVAGHRQRRARFPSASAARAVSGGGGETETPPGRLPRP